MKNAAVMGAIIGFAVLACAPTKKIEEVTHLGDSDDPTPGDSVGGSDDDPAVVAALVDSICANIEKCVFDKAVCDNSRVIIAAAGDKCDGLVEALTAANDEIEAACALFPKLESALVAAQMCEYNINGDAFEQAVTYASESNRVTFCPNHLCALMIEDVVIRGVYGKNGNDIAIMSSQFDDKVGMTIGANGAIADGSATGMTVNTVLAPLIECH